MAEHDLIRRRLAKRGRRGSRSPAPDTKSSQCVSGSSEAREASPVPQRHGRGLDRLTRHVREKAQQSLGAGGNRGKLDVVDGLRQFTDWATIPLAEKDESLSYERREALVDAPGLNGVVIANGLAHALGEFHGESALLSTAGFVLHRPVRPGRVRETIVIPLDPATVEESSLVRPL